MNVRFERGKKALASKLNNFLDSFHFYLAKLEMSVGTSLFLICLTRQRRNANESVLRPRAVKRKVPA